MRKNDLQKRARSKNGEARKKDTKHIIIDKSVADRLKLFKDTYSDKLGVKVTFERMLTRWMDHLGRIDADIASKVKAATHATPIEGEGAENKQSVKPAKTKPESTSPVPAIEPVTVATPSAKATTIENIAPVPDVETTVETPTPAKPTAIESTATAPAAVEPLPPAKPTENKYKNELFFDYEEDDRDTRIIKEIQDRNICKEIVRLYGEAKKKDMTPEEQNSWTGKWAVHPEQKFIFPILSTGQKGNPKDTHYIVCDDVAKKELQSEILNLGKLLELGFLMISNDEINT